MPDSFYNRSSHLEERCAGTQTKFKKKQQQQNAHLGRKKCLCMTFKLSLSQFL